jgi:hypothetical protein
MGKTIGIKLADGTFYPIVSTESAGAKELGLTTVQGNQPEVRIDLYRGDGPDGVFDSETIEYLDTLRLDQLLPHPAGDVDIGLTVILDEDDLFIADLFDPESGERSVKAIPHVTSRDARIAPPEPTYDLFGMIDRGQDVLDTLEDMDEEIAEVGGDEATEEIGLPFDDIGDDEVTASVESLFVDEERAPVESLLGRPPGVDSLLKDKDEYEQKAPPVRDALMKRVRFIAIAAVIIFFEVLVACFIIIRPRLMSGAGSRAHGNYFVSNTITPSSRS